MQRLFVPLVLFHWVVFFGAGAASQYLHGGGASGYFSHLASAISVSLPALPDGAPAAMSAGIATFFGALYLWLLLIARPAGDAMEPDFRETARRVTFGAVSFFTATALYGALASQPALALHSAANSAGVLMAWGTTLLAALEARAPVSQTWETRAVTRLALEAVHSAQMPQFSGRTR